MLACKTISKPPFWGVRLKAVRVAVVLGGTPYQYDGNARRLTWEYKLQISVLIRVFRAENQYFYS